MGEVLPVASTVAPGAGSARYWYLAIVALGFIGACFFYFTPGIASATYPGNTFLCDPAERFSDYRDMLGMTEGLDPYATGSGSIYPPLANLFFFEFSRLPATVGFALYLALPVLVLTAVTWRWMRALSPGLRLSIIVVGLFATEPLLFAVDRGNLDLWVLAALLLFVGSFQSRSDSGRELACVSLAVAIALKLHPVLLLFLFAQERRWRDLTKTLAYAGLLTLVACIPLEGGMVRSFNDFRTALGRVDSSTEGGLLFVRFNTGLYDAVWLAGTLAHATALLGVLARYYRFLAGAVGLGVVLLLWLRRSAFVEAYLALVALACFLPPLANDYRLILLLPGVLLLLRAERLSPRRWAIVLLLAALMVPKNEWILLPGVGTGDIGLSSLINPALLAALLVLAVGPRPRAA